MKVLSVSSSGYSDDLPGFIISGHVQEPTDTDCMYSVSSLWVIVTLAGNKLLTYDP